jgi:ubiquinone/menaquinone biosynthesis C-methylase UbiE
MNGSFDRIAERYDETRGYPEDVMARIVDAVEGALDHEGNVLETGVGTGRFARPLQRRGFDVVGIDISSRMLEMATLKGTSDLVRGDACALPFKDKSFESALSVHVMHLIPTWRCALTEIGRVTRRNLVSVAFERSGTEAEAIKDSYDEACERLGWRIRHPGVRERELSDLLPPRRRELITTYEQMVEVKKVLSDYEARTFSSQWNVPEDIHMKALGDLRRRYDGVSSVPSEESIMLLAWDIDDLSGFAGARA